MAEQHTAEPYTIETYEGTSGVVLAADGNPLFDGYFRTDEERDATRRRFVACVNACKGLATKQLEFAASRDDDARRLFILCGQAHAASGVISALNRPLTK